MNAQPQFWDFLEGVETAEQYDAFATYRDMGPRRRLTRVAQLHGLPYGSVQHWSQVCSWGARVADYDLAQTQEREVALAARRTQINASWADRRAQLLEQLEEIAFLGADQLLANLKNRRQVLRPNELRLITETIAKYQNLANGEATERVDLGLDMSKLSDTQLAQLEEIEQAARRNENNQTN